MKKEIINPDNQNTIGSSISPWLTVRNSRKAIAFYQSAFGAKEVYRLQGQDEDLVAKLSIDGAEFWVSNESSDNLSPENLGGGTIRMILTTANPDEVFSKALIAGATQVFPVSEEHDWRTGRLVDPFGLNWEIGCPLQIKDK